MGRALRACPSKMLLQLRMELEALRLDMTRKSFYQFNYAAIGGAETALSSYNSTLGNLPAQPIWAVAENYRFEPALVECKKLVADIGEMMSVQLIVEGSMNSSNPYFSSSWRRNFSGGFILDMGVHFIAGLRMIVGCEVKSVSAFTSHVDSTLPPPDNISSVFQLENGCSGVFVMAIFWRVVGLKGTLQVERGNRDGKHGYSEGSYEAEPRCSYVEGARDVAVLEAMLESGMKQGALVQVKKF
ncbi:hypothetical protein HYC85_007460 [Camellia sinensis]|uniref:GFO/IDH/MocA-like oxidoreductase domain-containing protein n=1 Tax=Camellia sinensis TaxID=4442 RepID=A0A7J7HRF7_CAMSI|nr:hypothetical protein HYC85_007460 [Camellia sinensis]